MFQQKLGKVSHPSIEKIVFFLVSKSIQLYPGLFLLNFELHFDMILWRGTLATYYAILLVTAYKLITVVALHSVSVIHCI